MKTRDSIRAHKAQVKAFVSSELTKALQYIIINAQRYAERNAALLTYSQIISFFHECHLRYQEVIDAVAVMLNPTILKAEVLERERLTAIQLQSLNNQLARLKEQQIRLTTYPPAVKPYGYAGRTWPLHCLLLLLILGDGVLNTTVFEVWGFSLWEAMCLGVLTAGLFALLAHFFNDMMLWGKTPWQRRAITIAIGAGILCLFTAMAIVRVQQLDQPANLIDASNQHLSVVAFILISSGMFVVAVAVARRSMIRQKQHKVIQEHQILSKQRQSNEAEQERVIRAIDNVKSASALLRELNSHLLLFGGDIERSIITEAHKGFAKWKQEYFMYAPGNIYPPGFEHTDYQYSFNTNFQFFKTVQK